MAALPLTRTLHALGVVVAVRFECDGEWSPGCPQFGAFTGAEHQGLLINLVVDREDLRIPIHQHCQMANGHASKEVPSRFGIQDFSWCLRRIVVHAAEANGLPGDPLEHLGPVPC